jgi:hypothetical protein
MKTWRNGVGVEEGIHAFVSSPLVGIGGQRHAAIASKFSDHNLIGYGVPQCCIAEQNRLKIYFSASLSF